MRSLTTLMAFVLYLLLRPPAFAEVKHPGDDLKRAKSLKIGYTVKGERRTLTVGDPRAVKDVLATLKVEGAREGVHAGLLAFGTVDFVMEDGSVVETMFVRPGQLDRSHWGEIRLADTKFYDRVCELASEEEGKNIDVLKNNKPLSVAKDPEKEVAKTRTLKIGYTVRGQTKHLTIEGPKAIQDLVSAIKVEGTQEGMHLGLLAFGWVEFTLEDGSVIKALFSKPTRLSWGSWGTVDLKEATFYDKVCELASKEEGRKVDVLKKN